MFVRLSRLTRVRAGWIAAAVYLLCVLAPGAAVALGNGAAPWLPAEIMPAAIAHFHEDRNSIGAQHMHADGPSHDHGRMQADRETNASHAKHHHDGKTTQGPCCAMLCLSAVPADLPVITKPSQPVSALISENYRRLSGRAPPLLYRPPIA
jgi:hypothetical protein